MAMEELQQALQAVEPGLKRHRPLARASQQLLADLAVLLSGLRHAVMLDYAPGATPAQLTAALRPLQQLLPSFPGCLLHLDGCCYAANAAALLQRLQAAGADASGWPLLIGFDEGGAPAALAPAQCPWLPPQLARLAGELAIVHGQQQQQQQQAAAWPLLDLDGLSSQLPAMPTLNGWLLGYPAVYVVGDARQAAAASRALSAEVLHLFSVRAAPPPGLLARGSCDMGELVVLSFTVPEALCDATLEARVQRLVGGVSAAAAACDDGRAWRGVRLVASCVGPQPVSL